MSLSDGVWTLAYTVQIGITIHMLQLTKLYILGIFLLKNVN
jgi:hypothetical protein